MVCKVGQKHEQIYLEDRKIGSQIVASRSSEMEDQIGIGDEVTRNEDGRKGFARFLGHTKCREHRRPRKANWTKPLYLPGVALKPKIEKCERNG